MVSGQALTSGLVPSLCETETIEVSKLNGTKSSLSEFSLQTYNQKSTPFYCDKGLLFKAKYP
jgi:hypothetical protein